MPLSRESIKHASRECSRLAGEDPAAGKAGYDPRHVADLDGHDRRHAGKRLPHRYGRALAVGCHNRHVDGVEDERAFFP